MIYSPHHHLLPFRQSYFLTSSAARVGLSFWVVLAAAFLESSISVKAFLIPRPPRGFPRYHQIRRRMACPNDENFELSPSIPITNSTTQMPILPLDEGEDDDDVEHHASSFMQNDGHWIDEDDYCDVVDDGGTKAFESYCDGSSFRWIHMERQLDPVLKEIESRQDVHDKILEVQNSQAQLGQSDLYARRWVCHGDDSKMPINGSSKSTSNNKTFSVLQFNLLAEGLSAGPDAKRPFQLDPKNEHNQQEKFLFGGFTDVPFPNETLTFAHRRWRLVEVLLGGGLLEDMNTQSPLSGEKRPHAEPPFDIICMEEVDRFSGFFAPLLTRLFGYHSLFVPKIRSPGVRMGWYSDGCAVFWKRDQFRLKRKEKLEFKVGNQVMIIATLQHVASGNFLVIAATHLKASKSEANERVRVTQVEELLINIQNHINISQEMYSESRKMPVIIAGDFNADPPSRQDVVTPDDTAIARLQNAANISLQSAYDMDRLDLFTTWKIRGTKITQRMIDYIFYDPNLLECQATLSIPNEDELEPTRLPGLRYPSDHMAIGARFHFVNAADKSPKN